MVDRIETMGRWFVTGDTHQVTARIGIAAGAVVGLAAFILGYVALFDLFGKIGLFPRWLGIFFPLLFDALEVTAAVFVLNARFNERPDLIAWRVVVGVTIAAVIANIAHAAYGYYAGEIDRAQLVLAVIFTSIFPIAVAITVHMIKGQITRNVERDSTLATIAGLQREAQNLRQQNEAARQEIDRLTADAAQRRTQLARLHADIRDAQQALETTRKSARDAKSGRLEPDPYLVQAYQIDGWIAAGGTQLAIAERLGISDSTVRNRIRMLNGNSLSQRDSVAADG